MFSEDYTSSDFQDYHSRYGSHVHLALSFSFYAIYRVILYARSYLYFPLIIISLFKFWFLEHLGRCLPVTYI